jgi:hypothetical protein
MTIKTLASTTAILAAGASTAFAGGLDRATFSSAILFEKGTYGEIAYGLTVPKVSAAGVPASDVAESFQTVKLGFKMDLNDKFALAFMFNNQPIGADINYQNTPLNGPTLGAAGFIDATSFTLLGKAKFTDTISAYGGVKYHSASAPADLDLLGLVAPLSSTARVFQQEEEFGYVAGLAYERPEIALRVALSYESKIEYNFNTLNAAGTSIGNTTAATPEAWTLEFQSGISKRMPNTLLFGSVRHAVWSDANIFVVGAPLTTFTDTQAYTIGVGQRFNDYVSGSFAINYEAKDKTVSSAFAPTDGILGISTGIQVNVGKGVKIAGGISYSKRGNTMTNIGVPFAANHVFTGGLKISKSF